MEETPLRGVFHIRFEPHGDHRGYFVDVYDQALFHEEGVVDDFTQHAIARSTAANTLRGLHFQRPPCAQSKLVRVQTGRIFDVIVDLRHGSTTYGEHLTFEISAETLTAVYVPVGCAHGYCTLSDVTEVCYAISGKYSPDHAGGVRWDDPDLGISWPRNAEQVIISDNDQRLPLMTELPKVFDWG